jgi:hypothetical protein
MEVVMSDINMSYDKKTKNLEVTCECGKPIVVANKYGMFCEDMCGFKESKKAKKLVDDLAERLCKMIPQATE